MHFTLPPEGKHLILTLCLMATFSWKTSQASADMMPGTTAGDNISVTADNDTIQAGNALNKKGETGYIDNKTVNGVDKSRLGFTIAGSVAGWAGMNIYLYESLYRNNLSSSFRFTNDLGANRDMDKSGHLFSSYTLSIAGIHLMKQTGMDKKRAAWIGGSYGTVFLATKEILDGFREGYGFSLPDMAANIAGSAFAVSQDLFLGKQVVRIKYSYNESGLAECFSASQEKTLAGRMIFNYKGQTHWLSLNINSLGGRMEVFPGWLNIAFGHSIFEMTAGNSGSSVTKSTAFTNSAGYRQVFIAPDIDLSAIDTGSGFINGVLRTLNFIKIPSPAIEYNRVNGFRLHLLFF